jgi:hypothetical protein
MFSLLTFNPKKEIHDIEAIREIIDRSQREIMNVIVEKSKPEFSIER